MRLRDFDGARVIVTGASSGIGRSLASTLATRGARVGLVARRTARLDEIAAEIAALGGDATALPCDVADRAQVEAAASRFIDGHGGVDLLVNNAGIGAHGPFAGQDLDAIETLIQINLLGCIYWTKAVLPHMLARKRGHVVFVSSIAGKVAVPNESVYSASKFALTGLAESLLMEVRGHGVHVMNVCPGTVRTDFFAGEEDMIPDVGRRLMIEPEAVVTAILSGLRRGRHEVVVPRLLRVAPWVRVLLPGFFRRMTERQVLGRKTLR